MTELSVQALLARSFALLAREQPQAHGRFLMPLAGLAVALKIDAEHFTAAFTSTQAHLRAVDGQESITVGTSRRTILEVLDDRRTLTEAVLSNAVEVVGSLEVLLRAHEGLIRYVHGAVRCAGFASLLHQLRLTCADAAHTALP
ncbi:sterol-binding-like protein [Corallococcus sp. AB045]|uniref:sterol-binding-like protein n=1 Tax=Corallococcus sp. AB045 TaxID=2316719 RepID=UPI001F3EDBAB|nr:sterol-binding-like protein [Corallococcus sp. AB045]